MRSCVCRSHISVSPYKRLTETYHFELASLFDVFQCSTSYGKTYCDRSVQNTVLLDKNIIVHVVESLKLRFERVF